MSNKKDIKKENIEYNKIDDVNHSSVSDLHKTRFLKKSISRNVLFFIIGALFFVCVVLILIIYFMAIDLSANRIHISPTESNNTKVDNNVKKNDKPLGQNIVILVEPSSPADPYNTIGIVRDAVTTKSSDIMPNGFITFTYDSDSPIWKTENSKFFAKYSVYHSQETLEIIFDEKLTDQTKLENTIKDSLIKTGFKETKANITINGSDYMAYIKDDVICNYGIGDYPFTYNVACATISDYEYAQNYLQPFYDAYKNAGNSIDKVYIEINDDAAARVDGYRKARGNISFDGPTGSGWIVFYKKDGEIWRYFDSGNGEPAKCSEYNTVDLKSAFKGDICTNSKGDVDGSIVQ
ncbi:MAG: hypothetical protein WCK26_02330 [Candidatus Saccharibacteria bacterium]